MKVTILKNKDYKKYIEFYKGIYKTYPQKKDTMTNFLELILSGKSVLNKRMQKRVVLIEDQDEPIMGAVLAHVDSLSEYVQISFFESNGYSSEAFDLLMEEVKVFGKVVGASEVTASLNIHVNYGLGFLASDFDKPLSFGMNYNPAYYLDYFDNNGFSSIEMVTYKSDMEGFKLPISDRARKRIEKTYTVRKANFNRYKDEIALYTTINNQAFDKHLFYYKRNSSEDYELYGTFKWLLKEENLLFVEKKGETVGFMLWYPDFNRVINEGKKLSVKTVIDYKILKRPIDTFKIVEMGIVPKEQRRGAILALFSYLEKLVVNRFDYMESSWILANNIPSSNFGIKWADGEAKRYVAYTRTL